MNFKHIFSHEYEQKTSFKCSNDSLWLAEFVKIPHEKVHFADLGTGCGIIACALAINYPQYTGMGIELDMEMAEQAKHNVQKLGLGERLVIEQADISSKQVIKRIGLEKYDLIVTNPPFYVKKNSRLTKDKQRQIAMMGDDNTLDVFFSCALSLLKYKGYFTCILAPNLLGKAINSFQVHNLGLRRMQCVYTKEGQIAKRVMLEARKGIADDVKIEPPLIVY